MQVFITPTGAPPPFLSPSQTVTQHTTVLSGGSGAQRPLLTSFSPERARVLIGAGPTPHPAPRASLTQLASKIATAANMQFNLSTSTPLMNPRLAFQAVPYTLPGAAPGCIAVQRSHQHHAAVPFQGLYLSPSIEVAGCVEVMMVWYRHAPLPVPRSAWHVFEGKCEYVCAISGALRATPESVCEIIAPALLAFMVPRVACSGCYVPHATDVNINFPGPAGTQFLDSKARFTASLVATVEDAAPGSLRTETNAALMSDVLAVHAVGCHRWVVEGGDSAGPGRRSVSCVSCTNLAPGVRTRRRTAQKAAQSRVTVSIKSGNSVSVSHRAYDVAGVPMRDLNGVSRCC